MVVCKFFQQGICKFGENCRFEHLREGRSSGHQYYGQGSSYEHTASRYNQGSNRYDHGSSRYDQGSNRYDHGSGRYDQGSHRYNQGSNRYDQGSYRHDQGSNRYDQGSNRYDQGSHRHDQGSNRYIYFNSPEFNRRNDDSGYRIDRRQNPGNKNEQAYRSSEPSYSENYRTNRQPGRVIENQDLTNTEILESISEDMEAWESGRMYLFTCYGFAREMKSFPGLEDISLEEIRLLAYEANASQQLSAYQNWILDLEKEYKAKRSELRLPDALGKASLLNSIEQIKQLSLQNDNTTSTAFASSVTNNLAFNTNALFGNASDAFSGNIFSNPENLAANFVGFGTTSLGFGFSPSTPPTTFMQTTAFAAAPQNVFSTGATSAGSVPMADSVSGMSAVPVTAQNLDYFQIPSVQSSKSGSDGFEKVFTPTDNLTSEEMMQFESARFTLGQIPTRPPPKHLV